MKIMSSEAVDIRGYSEREVFHNPLWHQSSFELLQKGKRSMMKTLDLIAEIIRNPKHPFRQTDNRPAKAQKHRYERRKIKEFIKLGDWVEEKSA